MVDEGRMRVRLWMMMRGGNAPTTPQARQYRDRSATATTMLTVRAIKITADGALGSRGAWLLEPYSDKPDSTGLDDDAGRARFARRAQIGDRRTAIRSASTRSATAPTAKC